MAAFIAAVIGGMLFASACADDLIAKTNQGLIQGYVNEFGIREWKGIPYAKPPVGEMRFEQSVPVDYSDKIYQATYDAPACPQDCYLPQGTCPEHGTSEDCLYLTVTAPSKPPSDPEGYPVLFWIHGGAFTVSNGDCVLYNGTSYALNDIVTVTINYRLAALGFMASESMEGNYGFLDQRLAMKWANANIGAFGGDPARITLAGQSAGAMSVGAHLISAKSKGLFAHAIQQSNPYGIPFHSRESAVKNANDIFTYLGCAVDDVACMRTKTVEEILEAQKEAVELDLNNLLVNVLPFGPIVEEGGEVPKQPMDAIMAGEMETMPMLSGSLLDEGQLFVFELFPDPVPKAEYDLVVDAVFGMRNAKTIKAMYPFDLLPGNKDGREVLNVLATDLLFFCPLRNVTRGFQNALGSAGAPPAYLYRFNQVISFGEDAWGDDYYYCVGYVCHGSDVPFMFNVFTVTIDGETVLYNPTSDEQLLAQDMVNAWSNFIQTGDPNKGKSTLISGTYPQYSEREDALLVLEQPNGGGLQTGLRSAQCDMWDSIGYVY